MHHYECTSLCRLLVLLQRDSHSTVYKQARSIHIATEIRSKEDAGPDKVLGLAQSFERYSTFLVCSLFRIGQVLLVD